MKPLTIEIHGTGTHNRGAELMAIAIAERIRNTFPDVRIAVPPSFGSFENRARYGFWTTWDFQGRIRSRITRTVLKYSSKGIHSSLGLIPQREIDLVLDASGFAFSDQWGPRPALHLLKKMQQPERKQQPLILLPQAFGPFKNPEVATATRSLLKRASLICVRDQQSLDYVSRLSPGTNIQLFPDFTPLVNPLAEPTIDLPEGFCAIVPNIRMLDKTENSQNYLQFLKAAINNLQQRNVPIVFILHDAHEDLQVISQLNAPDIPIVQHRDPRVLKHILGQASFVIASRFHALVSALSQGVPCIGAGWSHKYPELFREYATEDLLISDLSDTTKLQALLLTLSDSEARQTHSQRIQQAAASCKAKIESMWEQVEQIPSSIPR